MRARGCRREARRCGWRLCVVCLHYPVRLTTTRTHSCRRMRECADRAADAPLTLLRREHAGTRPPPALRSPAPHRPPTPPPPFNTTRASCQRANWYCIGSRRPTWRLTCAASRRLARWAGSRRCCRCRRMGEGRGGGGGGGTKPGGALPLLYRRTHYAMHPAKHYAKLHPMHCVPPSQVLPDADPDAAAQITRCLANLLLDDECRSRVVAHEGGLRLLLQQVRHRWGRRGERQWGPLP